jgi:leader peptidase (prepilin peptidase)/N-methyltransferase
MGLLAIVVAEQFSAAAYEWNLVLGLWVFPFILGACMGSFLNVCFYRVPLGISIVNPPSTCPVCGKRIPLYRNIPVFTWLWQRGRTNCCSSPIHAKYFLWEILSGLAGVVLFQAVYAFWVVG